MCITIPENTNLLFYTHLTTHIPNLRLTKAEEEDPASSLAPPESRQREFS